MPESAVPAIAVVIPAYKAAAHIEGVLRGIPPVVRHVIVVDDASPDDTRRIVEKWGDPRLRLVVHEKNQGVGGAVLSGYDAAIAAGAEILVKMDADGQMDPDYLWPLVVPIVRGQADYTKGNRFLHSGELTSMPLVRRIGNAGLSFMTKAASGYWNVFDPTNGYTAIHASIVPMLERRRIDPRYFFESSMFLALSLQRAVVRDVYIPARYGNEKSSLSVANSLVSFPGRLLRGTLRRWLVQYFLRDFTAFSVFLLMGLFMTAFGTVWGAYYWIHSFLHGGFASTGTVMIAVLPIMVGLQLLLQSIILDIQSVPTDPLQNERKALSQRPW